MTSYGYKEIAKDIYWVGKVEMDGSFHCNPYLIIDDDEAVLIDPGSVLDFECVLENVSSLIPPEKIKYVVLHHQDPDFCASVPLFEQKGFNFKIITHWRTQTLVRYYGIKSEYYIVNENDFKLTLKSGRVLSFLMTPYLHFSGAIVTYDHKTKVLFSSDLFGAISHEWSLYADDDYIERMKAFHEHYMPSNDILRPVMEVLLSMDISMIAPQHGSVIKDRIREHIKALRDLECGTFMKLVKKDIAKSGGYRFVCSSILKRYALIMKKEEVLEAVEGLDLTFDKESMEISDYSYRGSVLWDKLFENILAKKGIQWLLLIEPLVEKLSREYDIPMPAVFKTALIKAQKEAAGLSNENSMLKEINERLNSSIREAQDKLIRCPVTGLYNYDFFRSYISNNIRDLLAESSGQSPALIIISVDNMSKIRFSYGEDEVNEAMKNIVYLMNTLKESNMNYFRLQGASFACYIAHADKARAVKFAESIRNLINNSQKFIEKITVSIGVTLFAEIRDKADELSDAAETLFYTTMARVKLAINSGMNTVCYESAMQSKREKTAKVMIIDTDEVNIDVLKTFLENLKYNIIVAKDGEQAVDLCEKELPDLVVSEIMLPKQDGFIVRERMLKQSNTKGIPFIVVSYMKNDDSVQRAAALGVEHYFRKPYMLSELLGVIKNKLKGDPIK